MLMSKRSSLRGQRFLPRFIWDVRIDDVNFNEIGIIIHESLVKLAISFRICNYSMANYFLNKLAVFI
jgi:hypothetical protein